eukprot:5691083-Amphidinium_carterae.1
MSTGKRPLHLQSASQHWVSFRLRPFCCAASTPTVTNIDGRVDELLRVLEAALPKGALTAAEVSVIRGLLCTFSEWLVNAPPR